MRLFQSSKEFFLKSLIIFLSAFLSVRCSAQIVNVESKRVRTDTTGWAGSIGGSFDATKNVNTVLSADAYATTQLKTAHNLYLFLGDYSFLKGADKQLINKSFLHVRFNHKFTPVTRFETFIQYQNNMVTKINTRSLAGMGLRFKIRPHAEKLKMYLGVSVMYEYEAEAEKPVVYTHTFRNSSYLSLTWKPNDLLMLTSTTFYQPRLDKFSDFRILNQEALNIAITKKLSLTASWDYLYDAFPAAGVPRMNYESKMGIEYKFTP